MSTYERYSQGNQRQPSGQEPRKAQLASRNASTFNPISFNPESQGNIDDYEKQQKKEKQLAYRDQLNQMKSRTQSQRTNERNPIDDYAQRAQRESDIEREKVEQQRYNQEGQDNQRRQEEEAYLQEQYRKMAEYERYQQQMDEMEKNYAKGGNPYQDANEGYSQPQPPSQSQPTQDVRQYQYENVPQANRSPQKTQEDVSTFHQQDNLRDQLLSKIKGGYNNQNAQVMNSYQRVLESQEKAKKDFEQTLVNKAVQERQREDVRAMSEWDRKKRMQQEAADANRRAAEFKMLDKKKQKANDDALENQRNQDSLSQFERDNFRQKEVQRRMKEDANRVLEKQVQEAHVRKLDKEHNVTQFAHPSHEPYYVNERKAQTPLVPSYGKINQAQPANKNIEALDNLSQQMENKLSMKGSYGQDDYSQGYNQYSQPYGGGDHVAQDRYQGYQSKQGYEAPQQYPTRQQETQSRQEYGNAAEYQKNRFKARNTGYNIITGEFR